MWHTGGVIIVGLTGSIGSGKTTFADYLAGQVNRSGHWESWQLVAEVANALRANGQHPDPTDIVTVNHWLKQLPDIIKRVCNKEVNFSQLRIDESSARLHPAEYEKLWQYLTLVHEQPMLRTGKITEERKESLRSILQWLGGYLPKACGGDVWYAEIIRRIQKQTDLELATIGGVRFLADARCIVEAKGVIIAIERPGIAGRDLKDPTERERKLIAIDAVVHNDGTLEQLELCAKQVAKDLQTGVLAKEYSALT